EFGDLTIRDGHANLLIAVTNIEVPNTRRKLLKIKLGSDRRTGNGNVILTANRPQHVSVRRLNKREGERGRRLGLKVLNDPTAPRLNLIARLLVRFGETVLGNEPVIGERRVEGFERILRKRSTERCGRNTTTNTGIRLANVH